MSYFKVEIKGVKEAIKGLEQQHDAIRKAAISALNKTAAQTKTEASRLIRDEYNIPAGKVSQFLKVISKAAGSRFEAIIVGRGLGLALSYFGARQEGVSTAKKGFRYTKKSKRAGIIVPVPGLYLGGRAGGAVTVQVRKSSGRKVVSQDPKKGISQPFLVRFKSGHLAVVQRVEKARKPLKQLLGPGVAGLFGSTKIRESLNKFVNDKFHPIFKHELKYYLSKKQ
jgi:hypothetical protein